MFLFSLALAFALGYVAMNLVLIFMRMLTNLQTDAKEAIKAKNSTPKRLR